MPAPLAGASTHDAGAGGQARSTLTNTALQGRYPPTIPEEDP